MRYFFSFLAMVFLSTVALEAQTPVKSTSIVTIDGERFYVHTVTPQETLYSLSRLYGITEQEIKDNNPQTVDGLKADQVLKIPMVREEGKKLTERKRNRLFDTHYVSGGETLYSISRYYSISVNTLLEDNAGLDPAHLSIGQKLNIRRSEKGDASPEEIAGELEEYRDAINSVATDGIYHLVESGETLYALGKLYDVSEQEIIDANNLTEGLKAGSIIRIPKDPLVYAGELQVRADSLEIWQQRELEELERERDRERRQSLSVGDISPGQRAKVALMLPLTNENGETGRNFVEFYHGFLMGLQDLKNDGISADVSLYNTGRSRTRIDEIVNSYPFEGTNLIIGPVYEENLSPALKYAEDNLVPLVSPLAVLEGEGSPVVFQMSPSPRSKYEKLRTIIGEGPNVVYISTSNNDNEMEESLRPYLPSGTHFIDYSRSVTATSIGNRLERGGENIIIVSCTNEYTVDEILAKISSMMNNITARTGTAINIRLVGNSRWTRFRGNVDRELFFKLNLCYVTSYHADRSNEKVMAFDKRYINGFGTLPSLYVYRGYDAARVFISSITTSGGSFADRLNSAEVPLEMPYHFTQPAQGDRYVNTEWVMVCYKSDYTIEVH